MSTQIKEHPIIFSTDMVRAILEGKTQTRRTYGLEEINEHPDHWKYVSTNKGLYVFMHDDGTWVSIKCPYGQVGDRLWVRETWATYGVLDRWKPILLLHDEHIAYKAGHEYPHQYTWRPSLFMPRWASRILLEITGLRAERLQEISREDIRAEGIGLPVSPRFTPGILSELHQEFQCLWDSLNAKRGYPFDFNPWVWPISFKEVKNEALGV